MELKVFLSSGVPLTTLSKSQQERFIKLLENENNLGVKTGIEMALAILGYDLEQAE